MATATTSKTAIAFMVLTVEGADSKSTVTRCEYSMERKAQDNGRSGGIISLELILEPKSKELSQWATDNTKKVSGVISCKNVSGEVIRTITFQDALSKTFSETINPGSSNGLVSKVSLEASRISIS